MGGRHEKGQFVKEGHREEKRKALGEKRKEEGKSKMTRVGGIALPKGLGGASEPKCKTTDKGPIGAVAWLSPLKNEAKKNPGNIMD